MNAAGKGWITIVAATLITVFYLWLSWSLLNHFALSANPEGSWERALMILNGIGSLGFAAAGVLLGTSVQQANVVKAQKEASDQKAKADRLTGPSMEIVEKLPGLLDTLPQNFAADQTRIDVEKALTKLRGALWRERH
jgi:hypothetical protein